MKRPQSSRWGLFKIPLSDIALGVVALILLASMGLSLFVTRKKGRLSAADNEAITTRAPAGALFHIV